MTACLLAVALAALCRLLYSRERRFRRQEAARRLRRAQRERQWRAMIRGDDEIGFLSEHPQRLENVTRSEDRDRATIAATPS